MTTRSWSPLASMHLFSLAVQRVAHIHHPEVHEIVPSHHCVVRFRQRRPVRERGAEAVAEALVVVLENADVSRWPPGWAVSDRHTDLWAVNRELAFPLERTDRRGRYVGHDLPDTQRAVAAKVACAPAGSRTETGWEYEAASI